MIKINAKYIEMIYLGARDLARYKLRSGLTMLGMVFGVAAVISMLAIGEGSRRQALAQIEKLGIKNISIASRKPPDETKVSSGQQQQSMVNEYGIKFADVDLIKRVVPNIKSIVCGRDCGQDVSYGRRVMTTRVLATEAGYADVMNFYPAEGRFLMPLDVERGTNVAVIGQTVKRELFPMEDPLGKWIKVGEELFEVVGIMQPRGEGGASFNAADLDRDVYIPLTAGLNAFGTLTIKRQGGTIEAKRLELDEVVIQAKDSQYVPEMAKVVHAIFVKNHEKQDYVENVPLDLLLQKEREERVWNIVMGSIAGVSLLVGGIGIMNIMLASVTERTREIGIRRALGATRRDIVQQFLVETIVLATTGGITGIILGTLGAKIVAQYAGYSTVVTFTSVVLSFGISAAVGIIFGIYPAWQAAYMDPIEALRHE
jgi:putative ABC transport system permease protein